MLLHGTLVGTVPVAVPEQGVVSVQVEVLAEAPSEFPVAKIRFPDSSPAGPAPDIQIESKKNWDADETGCLSSSWFAGSAVRVVPFQFHPKSQPRDGWAVGLEGLAWKSQKLAKAA
jgi:hypothetical protein